MRKTNKEMSDPYYRRLIYIDQNTGEYVELREDTRKYLYQQFDKNRGIKYIPKNKRGGRHAK